MTRTVAVSLVIASACSNPAPAAPRAAPREPAAASPSTPPNSPAGPSNVPPTLPRPEISRVAEKTSRGGHVLAIGRPRFRLAPTCCDELVVRLASKRVLAQDRAEVKQWDLDGLLVERTTMSSAEVPLVQLVASDDGAWVVAGEFANLGVFHAGVRTASLNGWHAHAFVGSQLIASNKVPALIDANTGAVAQQLPRSPFPVGTLTHAFAGDENRVWWLTSRGIARWDKGGASFTIVTSAPKEWTYGRFALRGPVAVVRQADGLYGLELGTSNLTLISKTASVFAVSPTGKLTAFADVPRVRIFETSSGREIASIAAPGFVRRLAFAETDDVLAFDEDGTIRIVDLAFGKLVERKTTAPSRFRGWVSDGIASIDDEGAVKQLDVDSGGLTADRSPVTSPQASPLTLSLTDRVLVAHDNGKQVAKLDVGEPPRPGPGLEQTYWKAVASPSGNLIALWIQRPDVAPPSPPSESVHRPRKPACARDSLGDCIIEYVAELWSVVGGKPRLVWRMRPDGKRPQLTRTWPYPKAASGPIAFTPDGAFALFGFEDGDVIVRATDSSAAIRIESLHRAPITRIEVAPGGHWVFTEDSEGEQRVWAL